METIYLEKAKENLRAARVLFDAGFYNACANRAYYAAFHAAIAAISDIKKPTTSHKSVQAEFSRELIQRRKVYPGKLKSYLLDMQEVRNKADYKTVDVSKKVAQRQLKRALEFVGAVTQHLEP